MATIRKGVQVSLGLIQFPVNVQSAVRSSDTYLSNACVNGHDPTPIKAPKTCPSCNSTDASTFVKARKEGKKLVVLTEADLEAMKPDDSVTKEMSFTVHPADEVAEHTQPHGSLYYLAPTGAGTYNVVRDIVAGSPDLAFVTEWAARSAPTLYLLTVVNGHLAIHGLAWPETMAEQPESITDTPKHAALLGAALPFVEQQVASFDPNAYRNRRTELLAEIVRKADGTSVPTSVAPVTPRQSPEDALLAALQASIAAS